MVTPKVVWAAAVPLSVCRGVPEAAKLQLQPLIEARAGPAPLLLTKNKDANNNQAVPSADLDLRHFVTICDNADSLADSQTHTFR